MTSYPCSRVINLAISVLCSLMSSWYFNMICWRERIEVFFHDWKAFWDDSATASISDKGWTGTRETTSWVAGFLTSIHSVAAESFHGTRNMLTFYHLFTRKSVKTAKTDIFRANKWYFSREFGSFPFHWLSMRYWSFLAERTWLWLNRRMPNWP